jgi:gamma-glutamyltranspeptidase/glutathione hydrolase
LRITATSLASIWCPGTGLLAACIPGTFDTWMTLLRDYGTMRIADVLSPAIGYARNGYPLVERICATIDTVKDLFREHWPTVGSGVSARRQGAEAGHALHQSDACHYLRAHPARGGKRRRPRGRDRARAAAWSRGFVAEAIDKFCRTQEIMDTSGPSAPRRAARRRQCEMAGHRRGADLL